MNEGRHYKGLIKQLDLKEEEELLKDENLSFKERISIELRMKKKMYHHLEKILKGRKEHSLKQYLSWCRQKGIADSLDTITTWCRHKGLIDPLLDEDFDEEFTEDSIDETDPFLDEEQFAEDFMDEDSTDDSVEYLKTVQTENRYMVVKQEIGDPYFRLIPHRPFVSDDDEKCGEEED